jgi:hypothetical protein
LVTTRAPKSSARGDPCAGSRALGNDLDTAQYQHEPVLPDGNLIKLKWFLRYAEPPKKSDFVFRVGIRAYPHVQLQRMTVRPRR